MRVGITSFNGAGGTGSAFDWMPLNVWGDNGSANFGGGAVIVEGLPAGTYQVEVVAWYALTQWEGAYTVNGAAADRTFQGNTVPEFWSSKTNGLDENDWLIWDAVEITTGQDLTAQALIGGSGSLVNISAVRVTEVVPEPSTYSILAGLAVLGVVSVRRRRS